MPAPPSEAITGKARPYWTAAELLGCPFGTLICAVYSGEIPAEVLDSFAPSELEFARGLDSAARRREWIAGRLCLADALSRLTTKPRPPMLPTASGSPTVPSGIVGSISHKGPLAMALAVHTSGGVGVDVEYIAGGDAALENKVLTASERRRLGDAADAERARFVAVHFAIKEAVYKALDATAQSSLEFDEIDLEVPTLTPRRWIEAAAQVVTRPRDFVRGAVLVDGDWIIGVALRATR